MSVEYFEVENRILRVIEKLSNQTKPNLAKVARESNVPYGRLLRRYHGSDSRPSRPSTNRLLSDAEELSVIQYISHFNGLMIPVKPDMVMEFVNSILERKHKNPSTQKAGQHWLRRFLDRNEGVFIEDQRIAMKGN